MLVLLMLHEHPDHVLVYLNGILSILQLLLKLLVLLSKIP